jgi:ribosomal-protein-alanine N-acetyltransferase
VTVSERGDVAVTIRRAEQADLLDVFRIEKKVFPQPWPFSAFERYLDAPAFLVAVDPAEDGSTPPGSVAGQVSGYVVADCVPNHGRPLGHVKDLAVHPAYQGHGVGSTLLDRALGVLAARGTASVKLEVRPSNDAALALYGDFGFEPLKQVPRYYADGEDALVMVLDLQQQ